MLVDLLQLSVALHPAVEVVSVEHVANQQLVQVDLLLVGTASAVEVDYLLATDLTEGIRVDALDSGIRRVQVDVVDLEGRVLCFNHAEVVVSVGQERLADDGHMLRQLVTLDKVRVEGIQDEESLVDGAVGEVRPVEAVGLVVLVLEGADVGVVLSLLVCSLLHVNYFQ